VGSRTAQLEEKLEDLVSLLRSQNTTVKPTVSPSTASRTASNQRSPLELWINTPAASHDSPSECAEGESSDGRRGPNPTARAAMGPQTPAAIFNSAFAPGMFDHQAVEPVPISSMIHYPWIPGSQRQGDEQLKLFREQYLMCFPCVHIPSEVNSEQLREEKPFTWFTIMMVTCQTSSLQFGMGALWQKIISQKIVIEHEKSIDLLQGMIVFLGWSVSPSGGPTMSLLWFFLSALLTRRAGHITTRRTNLTWPYSVSSRCHTCTNCP
jgi:hypothetical protein